MKQWLKEKPTMFLLGLILLASSWALLNPKFFRIHDYIHAARIVEMTQALKEGQFPVRWSANFGYGYGMPLFEFYGPLPFYIGAWFYWLGLDMILTLKLLFVLCSLFTMMGAYQLGQRLGGRWAGLVAAAALTLAPYRALNLFIRGALNEAWGIMALPWILYGIVKVLRQEKHGWLVLTLALVTLMLSHNLTTMMFVPVSLLFAAGYLLNLLFSPNSQFVIRQKLQFPLLIKTIFQLGASYMLATGLSAFYLFPAFLEKDFTKVEATIVGGYFDYNLHFLYIRQFFDSTWKFGGSVWGPEDDISFFFGWGQWLGLMTAGLLTLYLGLRIFKARQKLKILIDAQMTTLVTLYLLLAGSLYMSLLKSQWLWHLIPFFSFIQFPWRWLAISIVFLSLIIGFSVTLLKTKWQVSYSLVLISVMILGNFYYFRPQRFLDRAEDYYYTDTKLIRKMMSDILPDYIPSQMAEELTPTDSLVINEVNQSAYEILVNRGHEKLIKTSFNQDQILSLGIADFPGWTVAVDGQDYNKKIGQIGNIEVEVPAGDHLVGVKLGSTPVRRISDLISLVSLLLLSTVLITRKYPNSINRVF